MVQKLRPEGPVPEDIDLDPDPVFAVRSERPFYGATLRIATLLVIFILLPLLWLIATTESLDPVIRIVVPLVVAASLLIVTPFLLYDTWLMMIQVLDSNFVLDTDGVRSMRGDRVLGEVRFDRDTFVEVEVACLPERNVVSGFWFHKGWWRMDFTLSKDDVERTWPLLKAAAWKHRMLLGTEIERLLKRDADG